jgi:hypothetical protein
VLVTGFANPIQINSWRFVIMATLVLFRDIMRKLFPENELGERSWCFLRFGTGPALDPVQSSNPEETSMTEQARPQKSESREIPAEVAELVAAVAELPEAARAQIAPQVDRVVECTRRRRRILSLVQDALSQLRLDMKYLMFDLEATRRERDEYRRQSDET